MQLSNEWFVAAEDTDCGTVAVRGRLHMDAVRELHCYTTRVEIQWQLKGDEKGMPTDTEAEVIDRVMNIMCDALERSETAVPVAVYTGGKQVRYLFYATGVNALSDKIQPLLNACGALPIKIGAASDPDWRAYIDMIARLRDL